MKPWLCLLRVSLGVDESLAVLAPNVLGVHVPPVELLATHLTLEVALLLALTSVARRVLTIGQKYSAHPARETLRETFLRVGKMVRQDIDVDAGYAGVTQAVLLQRRFKVRSESSSAGSECCEQRDRWGQ